MKKVLFFALAGLTLVACQKSNEEPAQNGETKQVSIAIQNEQISRSALLEDVSEGNATAFLGGKLFFFNQDGSAVVHTHELTGVNLLATLDTTFVVGVPSAARSVAMIANHAGTGLAAAAPTSFTTFKELTYKIDEQAEMAGEDGVNAAGHPNAVQGIALLDILGTAGAAQPLTAVDGQAYTHQAAITLVPAVSRIEIAKGAVRVKATNATNLTGFDFTGIYINNYSPNYSLGLAQDNSLFGSTIMAGGLPDWAASYKGLTPSEYLFHDDFTSAITPATNTFDGYAFHVFPGTVPHIILRGSNFTYTGAATIDSPQYWRIEKYWEANANGTQSTTEITEFKPGYVYKIAAIAVGDSFSTPDPYDDPVSVQVTLTVQAWNETNVFVEPE